MAERIIQKPLDSTPNPDNDFIIVDSSVEGTRRVSVRNIANVGGPVTSVNGETGAVVIDADDINDTSTTKKLVTVTQLNKIEIIKTDQGLNNFLAGDGVYRTPGINDAANIGTGEPVFAQIASSQLQFKTLKENDDFVITGDSDSLTLGVEYNGTSTTTTTVGGLGAGTNISGKSMSEIIQLMTCPYQLPTFSAFSVSGQAVTIEVGTSLSGSKTFTWSTSNSGNVASNSIVIRDMTASTNLANSLANDGSESVTIATVQLNSDGATQAWRAQGTNTQSGGFNSSNFTVTGRYYRFYGPSAASPTNSTTVRALPSNAFHSTGASFTLNTGSTLTKFIVALPPSRTISSVIDSDALNANITSSYLLTGTINVVDAGGTNRSYNIYEMNIGAPYASSHTHQITTA